MHRPKHEGDSRLWYAASIFVCKQFPLRNIVSFVEKYQPRIWFQTTFEKIKKCQKDEDDCQVATKVINVSLTCKITMVQMKTPVKGQWCDHYECFDINTYLESNQRAQIWKCPVCPQDKPVILSKDEFMMALIEVSRGETDCEIDYENLEAKFAHGTYSLTPEGLVPKTS
jgi:hypothetical protein